MHPDAIKAFAEYSNKKEALIKSGHLPEDIPWERFAYTGHDVVHTYGNFGENAKYRCVKCMTDFNGKVLEKKSYPISVRDYSNDCPNCLTADDVWQLNINRKARWRCVLCTHEWDSEIGHECPFCGAIKE